MDSQYLCVKRGNLFTNKKIQCLHLHVLQNPNKIFKCVKDHKQIVQRRDPPDFLRRIPAACENFYKMGFSMPMEKT